MPVVIGLFDSYKNADQAINNLESEGIDRNSISIISRKDSVEGYFDEASDETSGVEAGLAGGAAIGGIAGLLTGIAALAIPGIGPVLTAGTLATALGSAAAGAGIGAATGGLLGALIDAGVPENEASAYAEGVKRGGILISVNVSADTEEVARVAISEAGAVDIKTRRSSWSEQGWHGFDSNSEPNSKYPAL